jgi:hypothetical protein
LSVFKKIAKDKLPTILLRLPQSMKDNLEAEAAKYGQSVNTILLIKCQEPTTAKQLMAWLTAGA